MVSLNEQLCWGASRRVGGGRGEGGVRKGWGNDRGEGECVRVL